ncbi:MAG TPA: MarR family winged helix-turn-helix transcriptional regulator [Solirubrobacteraceae bacterium]|nr:MarR family winged helix-turn-helix transcriptional regulator [Solirubrobacteraceae bacterium]
MDTSTAPPENETLTVESADTALADETTPATAGGPSGCAVTADGESASLEGDALEAWRSYLQSHATILRLLDAELVSEHGITTRDYEVMLYLAQAPDRRLPMSALAESTMLTRSGITRLVDGLVSGGFIERAACPNDARVSYAQLTDEGFTKLARAGCTHVRSIRRLFLEHFGAEEIAQLASLLGRLPGAQSGGACTVER